MALSAIIILSACGNSKPGVLSPEETAAFMALGERISAEAQHVLLQNVAGAIGEGGTDYAVGFCNVNAIPLTDSVANHHKVLIQRLSDKNRNPGNAIQTKNDSLTWEKIKTEKADFIEQDENGDVHYYKPILIGMPACIKCHGGRSDITESTLTIIREKYPDDKAVNYKTGDLRGMWKIKLVENEP